MKRLWKIRADHAPSTRKPRRARMPKPTNGYRSEVLNAYDRIAAEHDLTLDQFLVGIKAGWITVSEAPELRPPFRFVISKPQVLGEQVGLEFHA